MHLCNACGSTFEEPETIKTTYESFYGVGGFFNNSTPLNLDVCPVCNCEDFIEIKKGDSENEKDN